MKQLISVVSEKHAVRFNIQCKRSSYTSQNLNFLNLPLINLYDFFRYVSKENVTGFCRSSQLKVADFSYNFLVGSIPKCLEYLPRYFLDTLVMLRFYSSTIFSNHILRLAG